MPQLIKRHLARLCCALLLLAAAAVSASADPLVITSGTFRGCPSCVDEVHSGNFFGGGFRFSGGSESFRAQRNTSAGGPVSASSSASFHGLRIYTAESGGSTYYINRGSALVFTSATVVVPTGVPTLFIDVPFTLSGTLYLTDDIGRHNPPVFTFTLSGAGIARITLGLVGDGIYVVRDISYTFLAPEAVPEPATVILLGTGLAGALMRRRKGRAAARRLAP